MIRRTPVSRILSAIRRKNASFPDPFSKLGITAAKALGYQQVVDYLDGLRDLNDTFMDIAQKTKRLARKQMGWFGRDPRIHWLQALNPALLDNAMAIIEHADAGAYDAIDAQADAYTQHHLGDLA